MYDTKNNFAEGRILSHIMRLSIPMITAQLINILYNIIDRIFIGHMPYDATNALTGLGVAEARSLPSQGAGATTGRRKRYWATALPCL